MIKTGERFSQVFTPKQCDTLRQAAFILTDFIDQLDVNGIDFYTMTICGHGDSAIPESISEDVPISDFVYDVRDRLLDFASNPDIIYEIEP